MGKYFTLLLVLWLAGLLVCAQRMAYWNGEAEDAVLDWYNKPYDEKWLEGEEFLAHQEADRKRGFWTAGMVLWGAIGVWVLVWVWRWEEGRSAGGHGTGWA